MYIHIHTRARARTHTHTHTLTRSLVDFWCTYTPHTNRGQGKRKRSFYIQKTNYNTLKLIHVLVGDEPVLQEPLKDTTVVSPNTAKFTATVKSGDPRADIQWFKGGKKISASNKYTMSFEGDVVTLEISDTKEQDADHYSFEAVNKVGKVTSKATLTVHGVYTRVCVFRGTLTDTTRTIFLFVLHIIILSQNRFIKCYT